uniref:CP n=1 Tax=Rose leaf rosette-associated virus TaxID=1543207 RepID=A0A7U1BMM3_9CLOS|nr:CP [Rose leaf rosette-associated virus]
MALVDDFTDLGTIVVADSTAMSFESSKKVAEELVFELKKTNNLFDVDKLKTHWAMVLYRMALLTTSPQAKLSNEITSYKIGDKEFSFSDDQVFNFLKNHPKSAKYPNFLRSWGLGSETIYLDFMRRKKGTLHFTSRATRIALPEGYEFLCADFLSANHLKDNKEREIWRLARDMALAPKESNDAAQTITSLTQLGLKTHGSLYR